MDKNLKIDTDSRITFLGLGAMGSRMAARLIDAGFHVTLYSRTPGRADHLGAKGAKILNTAAEACKDADIVISMVTDDAASKAIWLGEGQGALSGLCAGAIAVEASTLTPAWARELAASIKEKGGHLLDAPVIGTLPQAEAGQLIFLVGGDDATNDAARPLLETMGTLQYVGEQGQGMAIKLAANAFFAVQVAALSEALGLAVSSGIAKEKAAEIFKAMPITGPVMANITDQIMAGSPMRLFPIDLVSKDLSYVVSTAQAVSSEAAQAGAALTTYQEAQSKGLGDENISAISKLFL